MNSARRDVVAEWRAAAEVVAMRTLIAEAA
jgi:hypothetical protein